MGVTSRNSHVTLLTNLGQFPRIITPVTPPMPKFHIGTHQVLNMLSHVFPTSIHSDPSLSSCFMFLSQFRTIVHYCPVIVFLFRLLYQQLRSRTLLCFLLCLIVFSFLLFLTPVV